VLHPDFHVSDALKSGHLIELMPDWRGVELGIYAVYPSHRYLSAKVRLLVDYLIDRHNPR
jgi:DNA-binding transcriptional LysR family regulator